MNCGWQRSMNPNGKVEVHSKLAGDVQGSSVARATTIQVSLRRVRLKVTRNATRGNFFLFELLPDAFLGLGEAFCDHFIRDIAGTATQVASATRCRALSSGTETLQARDVSLSFQPPLQICSIPPITLK
jgi:hypothetical protein